MTWALRFCLCLALATQVTAAERRYTTEAEAERWRMVGLVDRRGGGRCTGALIRADVVLTAAHCVASASERTQARPSDVRFIAGRRGADNAGVVQARTIEVHPGYFATGARYGERQVRADLAKITLQRPITGVSPLRVDYTPSVGAEVMLLSYSQGRQHQLSIQSPCQITDRRTEFLELDCHSSPGASGAPYVRIAPGGSVRIVGVNSGRRGRGADATALALAFDHMRDFIGPSGGAVEAPTGTRLAPSSGATRLPGASTPGARIGKRAP